MRSLYHHVRSFVVVATFAAIAIPALAQERPAVLSSAEIGPLVERAEPGDHARLALHYAALAERYEAEVKQHTANATAYNGNSKLAHMAVAQAAHCKKLADRRRDAAKTAKEMAQEHSKSAGGAAPTPRVASSTANASQSPTLTPKQLSDLVASASTAADHRRLEQYFADLAAGYERDAANHVAYAKSWRAMTKNPSAPRIAAHCDRFATELREMATEARGAADTHKQHAATAK